MAAKWHCFSADGRAPKILGLPRSDPPGEAIVGKIEREKGETGDKLNV